MAQNIGQHSFHCLNDSCKVAYYVQVIKVGMKCKQCGQRGVMCQTVKTVCKGSCGFTSINSIPTSTNFDELRCEKCAGPTHCIVTPPEPQKNDTNDEKQGVNLRFRPHKTPVYQAKSPSRPVKRWQPTKWQIEKARNKNRDLPVSKTNSKSPQAEFDGQCLECGKPIPAARLQANPEARLCIRCAETHPSGQKNRVQQETWGNRDAWKKDRGSWKRGGF